MKTIILLITLVSNTVLAQEEICIMNHPNPAVRCEQIRIIHRFDRKEIKEPVRKLASEKRAIKKTVKKEESQFEIILNAE